MQDNNTYRLARNGSFRVEPFGPAMTLAKAQAYQADIIKGGFDVLVINTTTVRTTHTLKGAY